MKDSIKAKLESVSERHEEIAALLGDADTIADQNRFRDLSREYSQLEPVVKTYADYNRTTEDLASAREMAEDPDPEMREMAKDEISTAEATLESLGLELQKLLLPRDPRDENNVFIEIRAGTGGDEAAIFAGDLFKMYSRYAEGQGWRVELISEREGEHGGYKEVVARLEGNGVFSRLKFESGAHRVQRVPETESQGRIHTSAATVAVLPEVAQVEEVNINPADLRIDTYRAQWRRWSAR